MEKCMLCKKELYRRGLCVAHYSKFRRDRTRAIEMGLDPHDFEEILVERGLLAKDARSESESNPFNDALEELKRRTEAKAKVEGGDKTQVSVKLGPEKKVRTTVTRKIKKLSD